MNRKLLALLLAMSLLWTLSSPASAGVLGYSMRGADQFKEQSNTEPSAAKIVTDGLIARPLGLVTTLGGTGLFIVTLPFSVPSGSVREAAHGMIVKPGGWTFVKPLGRPDQRFMEQGIFPQTLEGTGGQQR